MLHRGLVAVNAVLGAILAVSGAITAYANTLGNGGRWVSAVLGGLGVAELVAASVIHAVWGTTSATAPLSGTINSSVTIAPTADLTPVNG